jgi:predicted nucleic-acid-binding protein
VKVIADTNVLARAVLQDDPQQEQAAAAMLERASLIAISLPTLCEFVWVLRRGAKLSKEDVALSIRDLLDAGTVPMNRPAAEAGLAVLEAGGDFADGVIAHDGAWLGGETFVSFDRKAVELVSLLGQPATLITQSDAA